MPGITKSMPPSASTSLSVSDALTNLSKAATVALNAVQGSQEHVYQELERTRTERDSALKAFHDAQLDSKDMEVREEGWKAALDKTDLTIKHQAETITQLRSEIQTWKTQLARLEESSRQEIDSWKEQYRRAEHERARLSSRIEELIAGQLAWNAAAHAYTTPYTPRISYNEVLEPSKSSSAPNTSKRATGRPRADVSEDEDDRPLTSVRKAKAPTGTRQPSQPEPRTRPGTVTPARASTARRRENAVSSGADISDARTPATSKSVPVQPQTGTQPRTKVLRRVTAIVDVKEESDDEGGIDNESVASGSAYDPGEDETSSRGKRRRRASNVSGRLKPAVAGSDEDDDEDEEGTVWEDEGMDDGEQIEDDELLLESKPAQQTRKFARTRGQTAVLKHPRPSAGAKQPSTAKKRKMGLDEDSKTINGRPGAGKTVKTR